MRPPPLVAWSSTSSISVQSSFSRSWPSVPPANADATGTRITSAPSSCAVGDSSATCAPDSAAPSQTGRSVTRRPTSAASLLLMIRPSRSTQASARYTSL